MTSDESFTKDPPNATVSVFSTDGSKVRDAVVVLKTAKLDGDRLTFDVDVLEGDLSGGDGPAALFIDRFGFGGFHAGGFHAGGFGGFHASGFRAGGYRGGFDRVGAVGVGRVGVGVPSLRRTRCLVSRSALWCCCGRRRCGGWGGARCGGGKCRLSVLRLLPLPALLLRQRERCGLYWTRGPTEPADQLSRVRAGFWRIDHEQSEKLVSRAARVAHSHSGNRYAGISAIQSMEQRRNLPATTGTL